MKNIIKIFAYLLLSISLLLFGFSLNFINKWNKQNNQISKQLDEISETFERGKRWKWKNNYKKVWLN